VAPPVPADLIPATIVDEKRCREDGHHSSQSTNISQAAPTLPGSTLPATSSIGEFPASLPLQQRTNLVDALTQFGIQLSECPEPPHIGPSIIRYRIRLAPGTRLDSLRRCQEDISRTLGQDLAVIALPNEPYIALDIPRRPRQFVSLVSAIDALPAPSSRAELLIPFGVTPDGLPVSHDLSTLPHVLVAGSTNGGKTMFIRCMIVAFALRWAPSAIEILVVDLKSVDFTAFGGLPHLRGAGIISDPYDAIEALRELVDEELPRRTRLLQDAGCTNFRELTTRNNNCPAAPIVVIIDEFAELISVLSRQDRRQLERSILRLSQRARALGVHLVLATQRPSTDLITGSIKANFPCRVSFRLPQRLDSMVVLDQAGAEKLLGSGDMLLLHEGQLCRLQGYCMSIADETQLLTRKYPALVPAQFTADHYS